MPDCAKIDIAGSAGGGNLRQAMPTAPQPETTPKALPAGPDPSARSQQIASLAELCTRLQAQVRNRSKLTLLREGDLHGLVRRMVEKTRADHLERELAPKAFRLGLGSIFLRRMELSFAHGLEENLRDEAVEIGDRLRLALPIASEDPDLKGLLLPLGVAELELAEILHRLVALEPRYRGELPRRTLLHRLGEGRRVVFVVLMALGLIGTFVGINVRRLAWMGFVLMGVFVFSVASTYRKWGKEDAAALGREVEKAREMLQVDLTRIATDFERERTTRLVAALEEIRRLAQKMSVSSLRR